MTDVLLLQFDGTLPNLALMRLAAHHRRRGDQVTLRQISDPARLPPHLTDPAWRHVYGSAVFDKSLPIAHRARQLYPDIVLGGPAWDLDLDLEDIGVVCTALDYSDFPDFTASLGYTQRGCRFNCGFCVVPQKEGRPSNAATIADIWRGEPWPRSVVLLDNDFFGATAWPARVDELAGFRVCLTQGINARLLTDDTAAALASLDYRANDLKVRRIYTAWDRTRDEARVFRGLEMLVKHGVNPRHLMVYMLTGFDPTETHDDREHRRHRLREFGADPYPMVYRSTPEIAGFQRWVVGSYDKRIPWHEWVAAKYRPRTLLRPSAPRPTSLWEAS